MKVELTNEEAQRIYIMANYQQNVMLDKAMRQDVGLEFIQDNKVKEIWKKESFEEFMQLQNIKDKTKKQREI